MISFNHFILKSIASARAFAVTLFILFTVQSHATNSNLAEKLNSAEHQKIQVGSKQNSSDIQIDVQTIEIENTNQIKSELAQLVSEKTKKSNTTVVLSTDDIELIQKADAIQGNLTDNQIIAVPLLSEPANSDQAKKSKFKKLIHKFSDSAIETFNNNRIGIMITTYSTITESMVWIHSTNLSEFQRTSSVVYTVSLGLIFGVKNKSFAYVARPFNEFFKKLLKPENDERTNLKNIAAKYFGNLSLSFIIGGLRIPILHMDQIIDHGLKLHYFSLPMLLTVVSTTAMFTWSEHSAMINEKTHPVADYAFYLSAQARRIIVASLASSAAFLSPEIYGATPWITIAAFGVTGAAVYMNSDKIVSWIENNKYFRALYFKTNSVSSTQFESFQCRSLFAN